MTDTLKGVELERQNGVSAHMYLKKLRKGAYRVEGQIRKNGRKLWSFHKVAPLGEVGMKTDTVKSELLDAFRYGSWYNDQAVEAFMDELEDELAN